MALNKEDVITMIEGFKEAGLFQTAYKNDPASTSLTPTGALQGPLQYNPNLGGAFSAPAVRPERFSALPRVRGIASLLAPLPNEYYNEIIGIVTGATAGSGTNAEGYCGDAPIPGNLKQCRQEFQYGKYYMKTPLESINDIGYLRNRAEVPAQILNTAPQEYPLIPDMMWRLVDTRSQLQYDLYMQGIQLERSLEQVIIRGDATLSNTQTQLGFIKEFKGLDQQIKTDYTDTTGVACPAADSYVIDFGGSNIGGTVPGGDARTFTNTISDMMFTLWDRAHQVGMDGIDIAIVMRKEMFRAATDVYANTYATSRFLSTFISAGTPLVQDATAANQLRIDMLNNQYLVIEGVKVPVVFSDGILLEGQGNNTYMADMYFVPLNWAGRPLLRLEYFNLANQYATEYNAALAPDKRKILNNGLFAMGYHSTGFCEELLFASVMRLILETPFLAGRIDNVVFSYLAGTRTAIPGQSLYVNGGLSYYTPGANGI